MSLRLPNLPDYPFFIAALGLSVVIFALPAPAQQSGGQQSSITIELFDEDAAPSPPPAQAEPAPDPVSREMAAALALWREFQEIYQARALEQLSPAQVTEAALKAGVAELGPRYAGIPTEAPDGMAPAPFYQESLEKISAVEDRNPFEITEVLLAAFCAQLDDYSSYETTETKVRFDSIREVGKGAIGMQLQEASDGSLLCYPFPGQAADKAGILKGSRLVSVDGHNVRQATLIEAASLILGPPDTSITLEVQQPHGAVKLVQLRREDQQSGAVMVEKNIAGTRIWIRNFNDGVASQLKAALDQADPERTLTLDLRGNGGGVLNQAILAASLFIPEGKLLGTLETPRGMERFVDGNPVMFAFPQISLQIDAGTASAAELFALALLKYAEGATLYGEKSHGKGVTTDLITLRNGGILNIVSGQLSGPEGRNWSKQGLEP